LAEIGVDGRILYWIMKKQVVAKVDWINPAQVRDRI
jgi:hypothetical protein